MQKCHFIDSLTERPELSQQAYRTEKVQNCLCPKFAKKFIIDYYFEMVQKLKFGIYDIDNKTVDLSDDDFLGELECTLGQVQSPLSSAGGGLAMTWRPSGSVLR